jgi:hypothetical protein
VDKSPWDCLLFQEAQANRGNPRMSFIEDPYLLTQEDIEYIKRRQQQKIKHPTKPPPRFKKLPPLPVEKWKL